MQTGVSDLDSASVRVHHPRPGTQAVLASAWALGNLGQPGAVPAPMGALGDPSAVVRRQAAPGLGALKARGAVAALRRALEDENGAVRRAAERLFLVPVRGLSWFTGQPRAEARGYYPRPLPGAGTEVVRHPGRKAINLGVWGGAPGLENARNTPTGVPYGNISGAFSVIGCGPTKFRGPCRGRVRRPLLSNGFAARTGLSPGRSLGRTRRVFVASGKIGHEECL